MSITGLSAGSEATGVLSDSAAELPPSAAAFSEGSETAGRLPDAADSSFMDSFMTGESLLSMIVSSGLLFSDDSSVSAREGGLNVRPGISPKTMQRINAMAVMRLAFSKFPILFPPDTEPLNSWDTSIPQHNNRYYPTNFQQSGGECAEN